MKCFFEFSKAEGWHQQSWLVLGKGPSYKPANEIDITENTLIMSINHTCRENFVDVAHITDLEVLDHCAESLLKNARYLVMPLHPHKDHKPTTNNLNHFINVHPIISAFSREDRLLYYVSSTCIPDGYTGQSVKVSYFSGDAVLALLAMCGARAVYTAGIDGGRSYSSTFNDLSDKTLLTNGRASFDDQNNAIGELILKTGIEVHPISTPWPINIYVGSQQEQMLAVKVLEFSIQRHSNASVCVTAMHEAKPMLPIPKEVKNRGRTPFSFQRFLIPELNDYRGRAIYLDSDMQVFTDIRDLWERSLEQNDVLSTYAQEGSARRPQFSVMLLDCEKLAWNIDEIVKDLDAGKYSYENLMYEMCVARSLSPRIEHEWNSLESFEAGKTKLVHYTDMRIQPWLTHKNPLCSLWVDELILAVRRNFLTTDYIFNEILNGNVRPSLYPQTKHRKVRLFRTNLFCEIFDFGFTPPHMITGKGVKKHNSWINRFYRACIFKVCRLI